jgi:hypothetical protein
MDKFREPIHACPSRQAQYRELVVPAINRQGKAIRIKVTRTPLAAPEDDGLRAIPVMDKPDGADSQSGGGTGEER